MNSESDRPDSPSEESQLSISDDLRELQPEMCLLIEQLASQVRALSHANRLLHAEVSMLRDHVPTAHKQWISNYVHGCLAATGSSKTGGGSVIASSSCSVVFPGIDRPGSVSPRREGGSFTQISRNKRLPRVQSTMVSKVASSEGLLSIPDFSKPPAGGKSKTPRQNKRQVLDQLRSARASEPISADSIEVTLNPLLNGASKGPRNSSSSSVDSSVATPDFKLRRSPNASPSSNVALLSLDSDPPRSALLAAGVFTTALGPPSCLIAQAPGYLIEYGSTWEVLEGLKIDPCSQRGLKSVPIDQAETTFETEFYGKPFIALLSGPSQGEPLIVCTHAFDPKQPSRKMNVILRTPRGTDLLSMEATQIETLFQMSGTTYSVVVEVPCEEIQEDLLQFSTEQRSLYQRFKIGILLSIGEQTEDEMFSNQHSTPLFTQFLDWMASPIQLQGWEGFRGGLDVKNGSTGEIAYYTELAVDQKSNLPLLFHVSTLLPYNPNDPQQLERKRHLGNDIILIVFRENAPQPFDPRMINSHFNFVFIVVKPILSETDPNIAVAYDINVCCKDDVPPFGPYLTQPTHFPLTEASRQFLLLKLANAERSAIESSNIASKLDRTRQYQLQMIVNKYAPPHSSGSSDDLSKKEKTRSKLRERLSMSFGRTKSSDKG